MFSAEEQPFSNVKRAFLAAEQPFSDMATIVLRGEYGSIGVDPDVWGRASKRLVRLHAQFRARRRLADSANSAMSAYSLHVHTSGGSRLPKRSSFRAGAGSSRRAPGDRRGGSGSL